MKRFFTHLVSVSALAMAAVPVVAATPVEMFNRVLNEACGESVTNYAIDAYSAPEVPELLQAESVSEEETVWGEMWEHFAADNVVADTETVSLSEESWLKVYEDTNAIGMIMKHWIVNETVSGRWADPEFAPLVQGIDLINNCAIKQLGPVALTAVAAQMRSSSCDEMLASKGFREFRAVLRLPDMNDEQRQQELMTRVDTLRVAIDNKHSCEWGQS